MLRYSAACICVLLIAAASAASAQPPAAALPPGAERPGVVDPDRSATTAAGVIRGRVVAAGADRPLRSAPVVIYSAEANVLRRLVTDAAGRFEAGELPAGRYAIIADYSGYAAAGFGQDAPGDNPRMVTLRDGATEEVTLRLLRNGAIDVQVVDEYGDPVAGARVTAVPRSAAAPLSVPARTVGSIIVATDDRGHLRVFDLAPGEYLVRAELPPTLNLPLAAGAAPPAQDGYVPSFYPGTASPEMAEIVRVAPGQDVSGVVVRLVRMRLATVSGRIVRDGAASPASAEEYRVGVRAGPNRTGSTVFTSGNTFRIVGLAPGAHQIEVFPSTGGTVVSTTVAVDGVDITDLVLRLPPARAARGRVEFDGGPPPASLRPERVSVNPSGAIATVVDGILPVSPVRDDWTFEVTGITGTHSLRVSAPTPWRLARIVLAGRDVTDEEFDFSHDVEDLTIVLTSRASEISGSVTDPRGERLRDYTVVIFPEDSSRWTPQSRYIATGNPDQDGRYLVRGLPAGRYIAVAVDRIASGEQYDRDRLRQLQSAGVSFALGEYESRVLDLRLSSR